MLQWLKDRWEILWLSLKRPLLLLVFAAFQAAAILLGLLPPPGWLSPFLGWFTSIPWYGWVIGWLIVLWSCTLDYSVDRKKSFDETSTNFFKAYLDFLLKEGRQLFQYADDKDFYSKISNWQRKAVQGIAIGLGPSESGKFFQKMESQSPLEQAYRKSQEQKTSEALCRSLEDRLEELGQIRLNLPEAEDESSALALGETGKAGGKAPHPQVALLPGESPRSDVKALPKK